MIDTCLASFYHGIGVVPIRHNPVWGRQELFLKPGIRYDPDQTPYFYEIMMASSYDSPTNQITLVGGPQSGKTSSIIQVDIAQKMHQNPDNMIYAAPNGSFANKFSKSKIDPMINNTPCLRNLVSDSSSRDGGNTILAKQYPGGTLYIISSGSSADWRMIDADRVYLDDFDAHPKELKGEGSKKKTAQKRMASKGDRGKLIIASTPVDMINSNIWPEFLLGSQEYYYVPCPFCKFLQVMEWDNFKFDIGDVESIRLKCINLECGERIEEKYKAWMISKESGAKWIAHNPNRQNKRHRSFHLASFYSPVNFLSWKTICQDWFDTKEDLAERKAFKHLNEAKPWTESEIEKTTVEELMERLYKFRHPVPKEVLALTAFCDVQNDRLEVVTYGHGLNDQMWRIDKEVIEAPEGREVDHPIVWEQLEIYRKKTFVHESGALMPIAAFGIDTGGGHNEDGHFSEKVYEFVKGKHSQNCFATKGSSLNGSPLIARSKKKTAILYMVGTDTSKRTLMARLRAKKKTENGYIHFSDEMNEEECHQILSEELRPKRVKNEKGVFVNLKVWQKIRARNEEWDCLNGAYVIMKKIKLNFVALQEIYSVENRENIPETIESEYTEQEKSDKIPENIENVVEIENNNDMEPETNEEEETEPEETFDYTRQSITQRKNPRLIKERNRRRSSWWKR